MSFREVDQRVRCIACLALAAFVCIAAPARGATIYDTSAASIACNTLMGTVSMKPKLTEVPQPDMELTIKAKLGGCTVSGATPASPALYVPAGKLTAKLKVTTAASCITLASGFNVTGDFVFKWKTAAGQKLDSSSTTFTPDSNGLVADLLPLGPGTYGVFTSTGTLAAGSAFAGATPSLFVLSGEDVFDMIGQCCTDPAMCSPTGKGIKKLHLAIGQIEM